MSGKGARTNVISPILWMTKTRCRSALSLQQNPSLLAGYHAGLTSPPEANNDAKIDRLTTLNMSSR